MTEIEITIRKNANYMGAYNPKDNPKIIWLNVREIYDWCVHNSEPRATTDDIEEMFIKKLDMIFLQEQVCIFKTGDKLRIRGGSCNPYCRHEKICDMLSHPDDWEEIREFHRKKRLRALNNED